MLNSYFIFLHFKFLYTSSLICSGFNLTFGLVIVSLCFSCGICDRQEIVKLKYIRLLF